jgi:gamma-glutamyltranspeptidase / glutathione hydrolase
MRPFDWAFPYPSQRMPILARNVVATSQPLAGQAGLSMLYKGGNAADAVIATAITLTVVEPTGNGIGSDAFLQFDMPRTATWCRRPSPVCGQGRRQA